MAPELGRRRQRGGKSNGGIVDGTAGEAAGDAQSPLSREDASVSVGVHPELYDPTSSYGSRCWSCTTSSLTTQSS